jgi:hypothetical protein
MVVPEAAVEGWTARNGVADRVRALGDEQRFARFSVSSRDGRSGGFVRLDSRSVRDVEAQPVGLPTATGGMERPVSVPALR